MRKGLRHAVFKHYGTTLTGIALGVYAALAGLSSETIATMSWLDLGLAISKFLAIATFGAIVRLANEDTHEVRCSRCRMVKGTPSTGTRNSSRNSGLALVAPQSSKDDRGD